jgi:undecaprenyl-diphosphatase
MPLDFFSEIAVLDDRPLIWLNQFMFRWPLLDQVAEWVLKADIVKFLPMVLAVCWLWFDRTPKQAVNRPILVELLFTNFAALFIGRFSALLLPFRDRPVFNPDLHLVIPFEPGLRTWSSFPSDHAVLAFAFAASLFRLSPTIGLWACLHATVIICLPRLYFGLHYPSDLIAGGLIGIALALITAHLRGRQAVTGFFLDVERKHSAMFYTIGFFTFFEIAEMFESIRGLVGSAFRTLRQLLF